MYLKSVFVSIAYPDDDFTRLCESSLQFLAQTSPFVRTLLFPKKFEAQSGQPQGGFSQCQIRVKILPVCMHVLRRAEGQSLWLLGNTCHRSTHITEEELHEYRPPHPKSQVELRSCLP